MSRLSIRPATSDEIGKWDDLLGIYPDPHILQSGLWASFKSAHHWQPLYLMAENQSSRYPILGLIRKLALGFTLLYLPKAPSLLQKQENNEALLETLLDYLKSIVIPSHHISMVKLDPEIPQTDTFAHSCLISKGFVVSTTHPNFRRTQWIDLSPDPDSILESFKPKTRYNIRLAQKRGVTIIQRHQAEDLKQFYELYKETGRRQHFPVRPFAYYQDLWSRMLRHNMAELLTAYIQDQPVAGVLIWRFRKRAYYQYGASTENFRQFMPTYLLQWEAMLWAKSQGCSTYDLVGLPSTPDPQDPFYGVWKFKQGFGGMELDFIGAYDYYPSKRTVKHWPKLERYVKALLWKWRQDVLY